MPETVTLNCIKCTKSIKLSEMPSMSKTNSS